MPCILGDAGHEVWAVDVWAEHVEAIRRHGLTVEGASGRRTVRIHATSDPGEVGVCDLVVIATKARDVEVAADAARPMLGTATVVLPMQNGLGSAGRVAAVLGEEPVVIGVAGGFGASIVGPGRVHHIGWSLCRASVAGLRPGGSGASSRCGRARGSACRPTTTSTGSSGRS